MTWIVATFYKFVPIDAVESLRQALYDYGLAQDIKGTILLATEGINGTITGTRSSIDAVLVYLRQDPRFTDLPHKESTAETPPFERLKVKIKKEIVTLGRPEIDPTQQVGTYVAPQDWNQVISDPEVIVIDTRNDYEVGMGSFQGAQNPHTQSFREFPDYTQQHLDPTKHRKVAMFCTGGIRCEKASSYLLSQGFDQVYHLKGGILKYLEEIPQDESLWDGECFVFDERVALRHGLEPGSYDLCYGCGHPISQADKASSDYQPGICCPHCIGSLTAGKRARLTEKERQRQLEKQRRKDL